MPDEILIIALADRFKQPFEYFENLDINWVKKMFIVLNEENKSFDKEE